MITDEIHKSHSILIASHTQPDGDAIGSMLSLGVALKSLGKKVTLYNESPIPAIFRFLPSVNLIVAEAGNLGNYDMAIILDCGDLQRIGKISDDIHQIPVIINIDHHITNTEFGTTVMVDSTACATAEIIYRLIKDLGATIDKTIANALYTAILTDTGSFLFQNTNSAAFSISSEMVSKGADPYIVAQYVYATYSLGRLKLLNMVLDTIDISENGKLSTMFLSQKMLMETGTQLEDIYGLVNYAKHIEDVQVAALIRETHPGVNGKGTFHVSLRSSGAVDVSKIASELGGGGHCNAAGFKAESMTLSDLKKKIFILAKAL
ncbi:MAG: bifunctional oligoribonuclease/PAP phosphatase NrnA [Proteobacteria bacterium]|nr:bifunctional oligoribonuclease/PAP phosphatase NrnA [Pseudomonadota bacterium]